MPRKRRKILPYKPYLKEYARKLRNNPTLSEKMLWQYLKGDKLLGYDFDRQRPILDFIADFYCVDLMLVIELDGITHELEEVQRKDKIKQEALEGLGLTVLHFPDEDVYHDYAGVIKAIETYVLAYEEHTPRPAPRVRRLRKPRKRKPKQE